MTKLLLARQWACASALMLASWAATAADDPAARRDRELLQRARSALREASAERDALQSEKSAWAAEKQRLDALAVKAQADRAIVKQLRRQLDQQTQEALRLAQQLASVQDAQTQAAGQAQQRELGCRREVAQAQQEAAERAMAVRSTINLLEGRTAALVRAEDANIRMHAVGLKIIEQLRLEMGTAEVSPQDPLGWRAVRRDNLSDQLREALEQARVKSSAKSSPAGS